MDTPIAEERQGGIPTGHDRRERDGEGTRRGRRPRTSEGRCDVEARNRVVQANLGLVYRVARLFVDRGLTLEDLIGEGNLGLIRAAQAYDPARGTRFSTYACFWIREAIQAALANTAPTIRVPMNISKLLTRWKRAEKAMRHQRGEAPTFEEVAAALNLDSTTQQMVARAHRVERLQKQFIRLGDGPWRAISMVDPGSPPEEMLDDRDERESLSRRLEELGETERTIVMLKYGLLGEPPLSFEQIGDRLGLPTARVQRAASTAIRKLGQPPRRRLDTPAPVYGCRVG